jgi:hypothetical protein
MAQEAGLTPVAVLVVVADGPADVTRREDSLNGSTMDWCAPGADLGVGSWDLILLSNEARSPDMVDWVAREVGRRVRPGGKYQWRDQKR